MHELWLIPGEDAVLDVAWVCALNRCQHDVERLDGHPEEPKRSRSNG